MTTIYLVRHAEAEGNLCRRMHGQYDSNLTVNGLGQVRDLKKRFESIHVDACYTSDLTRAKNTAMAICIPNGLEFRVDPGFREVSVGIWEDVPFGYLNTFHGLKMIQFGREPKNWSVKGSETYQQYTRRFLESMEYAALRHEGGAIAIVSHSIVMKGVLTELFPGLPIPHSANTSVTCLEYDNGVYQVRWLCDSSHMDPTRYRSSRLKWWQQPGAQGDDMFWYREGYTEIGLPAPHSPIVYTVMEDQHPVGLICLSDEGETDGRIDFLSLIPAYQGYDLAVQLFGKAVSVMRKRGKTTLRIRLEQEASGNTLCRKLPFVYLGNQEYALDLTNRIYPV